MNKKLNNKQSLLYHMPMVLLLFLVKENLLHLIRDVANNVYSLNTLSIFNEFNEMRKIHPIFVLHTTIILHYTHRLLQNIKQANHLNEIEFNWLVSRFQRFYISYYKKYSIK